MTKEQAGFEFQPPGCFQDNGAGGCANKGEWGELCERCLWAEPGRSGPPICDSAAGQEGTGRVVLWKE